MLHPLASTMKWSRDKIPARKHCRPTRSRRSILKESYKEFEKLLIIIYTEILNFICKYKSKQRVLPKACVGFDSLYEGRIQKL